MQKHARSPATKLATIEWLFDNSRELLAVVGPDGCFKLVNPAWTEATGWTADELIGHPCFEFVHPDDLEGFRAFGRRMMEEGVGENIARVRLKSGDYRTYEGRNQLVDGDLIGILRDVTDQRASASELEDMRRTRRLLSEAAGIGSWSYEPEVGSIRWSEELRSITGYEAHEIASGEQFEAMLHPDEREAVAAAFGQGVERGEPNSFEHRLRARDGRWITWRATYRTEPRPGGLFALRGISQNITELVEARDAARQGEQQIGQLIQAAPFAVAMFDRKLRYMVVSPRWAGAFGLNERKHIGLTLEDVFNGVPDRFLKAQRRALAGEVVTCAEDRFKDSVGNSHWVRWEARPWRDASGKVCGVLCYVDDISALAEARNAAETNERRLKVALRAADAGVYEIDYSAGSLWGSPEFSRLIGRKMSFEDGQNLYFPTVNPEDLAGVRQAMRRAAKSGKAEVIEARVRHKDGQERWVRLLHTIARGRDGKPSRALGMIQDFDAHKRQELALIAAERAAQAAGEAKAAFLANMSHEIRTPMNGVMGVLHLLKEEGLSDDGRRMLEEALSCGEMLAELLNDVIDFSKIEAGRLELATEPVEPKALIEGVANLLRPQAEAKGLYLNVEADAGVGWVEGDPMRMRQALFNLLGNAVKFTLTGGVTVRSSRMGEGQLRFEIEDTGVGVPKAAQADLFERFHQGDASTTRRFGGSGLGLSITKRLAELMGGGVGFRSTPGEGSTFWFEVAAADCEAPQQVEVEEGPLLEGLRILAVEDNPTNRMIARRLLERLGAIVETAEDGYLGVEAASRAAFDLILMDVQMPGIDGLEAARRIRALPGEAAQTPIIALTANVLAHQRQSYLAAGMNGVVGKPISPAALLAEIARLAGPADEACESAA